jgi:hypothetical protein
VRSAGCQLPRMLMQCCNTSLPGINQREMPAPAALCCGGLVGTSPVTCIAADTHTQAPQHQCTHKVPMNAEVLRRCACSARAMRCQPGGRHPPRHACRRNLKRPQPCEYLLVPTACCFTRLCHVRTYMALCHPISCYDMIARQQCRRGVLAAHAITRLRERPAPCARAPVSLLLSTAAVRSLSMPWCSSCIHLFSIPSAVA